LAERACERWIASSIICGVAEVGGFFGAVLAGAELVVLGVGVGAVCAHVAGAQDMTPMSVLPMSVVTVLRVFMVVLPHMLTPWDRLPAGSPAW
jgi:hypothetical protein